MVIPFFLPSLFLLFAPCFIAANPSESYIHNQEIIIQNLEGIIISGDTFYPPDYILRTTKGVLFYRTFLPKNSNDQKIFLKDLESRAIGKPITFSDIDRYTEEIADFYLKHCNKYVFVELQESAIGSSILVIKVMESKIGEILVTGNHWFSEQYYKEHIALLPSETIDKEELKAKVKKINSSPWSKAEIVFKKGKRRDETDIELIIKDKKPVQFYSGADNSGVEILGSSRIYASAALKVPSLREQLISFRYESDPDFSSYSSFTFDYKIPFEKGDILMMDCRYAALHAVGDMAPVRSNDGVFFTISGKYDLALPQDIHTHQKFYLAVNYKTTNTDFITGGTKISPSFATIFQFAAEYKGKFFLGPHEFSGDVTTSFQPLTFLGGMSNATYDLLRVGASPRYVVGRANILYHYTSLDKRAPSFKMKIEGQLSSARLLPVEQFGLGGVNSVRGYVERAVNVDNALLLSVDLQSPKISLFKYVARKYRSIDSLYGVLFVDAASGYVINALKGNASSYFLLGAGPGVRYDISEMLSAKLDLGIRLGGIPQESPYNSRVLLYFSVGGSY